MDARLHTKPKVLIIDDDPTLRRLVQVVFERDGFDVSLASEGSEGVRSGVDESS